MKVSLRWQVLWAPGLALAVATALLLAEASARDQLKERVAAITTARENLDRVLHQLSERHHRSIRRASEAVLEPQPDNRLAILAWTSEHYVKEIEDYLSEARAVAKAVSIPHADGRLKLDLDRLEAQLARVGEQAQKTAPLFDALLSAVSADDPEATLVAVNDLARANRAMQGVLHVAEAVVRRAAVWQLEQALVSPPAVPRIAWLLLLLWAPLSLYIAQRPINRVGRLVSNLPPPAAASPEEHGISQRIANLHAERQALERQLIDRTRDAERAQQSTRRNEHELALLRLYTDNLVNSLRSAVVVTDAALTVRSFNRTARTSLELGEEVIDSPITAHPLYRALDAQAHHLSAEIARAVDAREVLRFENVSYTSAEAELILDLTIAPYLDESGAARGLLWVVDDVTEAVHTKSQLLLAERLAAVGRLSAQVAHEIRNPLSAIGLNAELLSDELLSELDGPRREEATSLLSAIGSEVERLTQVTESYLQLARLPRPNTKELDLNVLVTDLATMLREEMKAHGVQMSLELASPAPQAAVDPGQLRQALLNVLRNSREAMPQGGSIRIITRANGNSAEVSVVDAGPGIPKQHLSRIFEPFFSTKPAGTGLGLSLTQQIITEHGGSISATREEPHGTRITIALPREAGVAGSAKASEEVAG